MIWLYYLINIIDSVVPHQLGFFFHDLFCDHEPKIVADIHNHPLLGLHLLLQNIKYG